MVSELGGGFKAKSTLNTMVSVLGRVLFTSMLK